MNQPLRGHKGQLYEGAIRVPAFVNWPGKLLPRKVTAPIHVVDWMPTLTRLAGYKPEGQLAWDGADVWELLTGEEETAERVLYWEGPGGRSHAIRLGDWKLVAHGQQHELFHLDKDPHEQTDLATSRLESLQLLKGLLSEQQALDDVAIVNP